MKQLLSTPNNAALLRQAITQDELQGINRILVKKQTDDHVSSTPPPLPVKTSVSADQPFSTNSLDRKKARQSPSKMKNGCLDDSFDESEERFESCMDLAETIKASSEALKKQRPEGGGGHEHQAGELECPNESEEQPHTNTDPLSDCVNISNPRHDKVVRFGSSKSVPNSPGGFVEMCSGSLGHKKARKVHESRFNNNSCEDTSSSSSPPCVSCDSPESAAAIMNENSGSFTYSPPAVRMSKSEDQLQCPDSAELSSANTDLEDDVTASLNTLLDTRESDGPPESPPVPADKFQTNLCVICCQSSTRTTTTLTVSTTASLITTTVVSTPLSSILTQSSMSTSLSQQKITSRLSPSESLQSSHDSDSPLLHSPSPPQSPVSPSSSVPFSSSGVYDKMKTTKDANHSILSGNICSNSSSLTTSPDTDIPDELEWDETTPSFVPLSYVTKQPVVNGHASRSPAIVRSSRNSALSSSTHRNLVSVDTSSSSSSSQVIQEKVKRKKDENRIVIKVAGPDKSSSSSTLGKSTSSVKANVVKRADSSSSAERNSNSSRRIRKSYSGDGSVISSKGVTTVLTTTRDGVISPSVASLLTSSHGVGVIPGVDPDVTPTNTPQQTPPLSPTRSLQHHRSPPYSGARRHSSSPTASSPPQISPQTPGSGTLSPETLAYQQLWESEDEFTTSCISEDDITSRSIGGISGRSVGSSSCGGNVVAGAVSDGGEVGGASVSKSTSPPVSEDESDIESLHSFHYSPKAVDIPSAVRLAKRLYHLDGFKKTDVSRHLSKK